MIFAKFYITYAGGESIIKEMLNETDLRNQLQFVQDQIFDGQVLKAMLEPIDPGARPFADMWNNMASDLEKLKATQQELRKTS